MSRSADRDTIVSIAAAIVGCLVGVGASFFLPVGLTSTVMVFGLGVGLVVIRLVQPSNSFASRGSWFAFVGGLAVCAAIAFLIDNPDAIGAESWQVWIGLCLVALIAVVMRRTMRGRTPAGRSTSERSDDGAD